MSAPPLNNDVSVHTQPQPFGRILFVDLSHYAGGASTRTLNLLAQFPVGMASLAVIEGSAVAQAAVQAGLSVHVLGNCKRSLALAKRLRAVVVEGKYGIVDTQNAQSQFWTAVARLPATTARVSTLNSWYLDEYGTSLRGLFYHCIVRMTCAWTDWYIVVSSGIRARLLGSRVTADKISTIPAAVDATIAGTADSQSAFRSSLGLASTDVLLCSVGRLVAAKDYPCLIEAMQQLPQHVHMAIAGDGPLRESLVRTVRAASLDGRVHFMGMLPHCESLALIKSADALVMSSVTEGTPVVLLEAAVLETAVIATRVGGIPELFPSDDLATLVASGDATVLAEAIASVVENPVRADDMARRAAEHVKIAYSMKHMLETTLEAYTAAWNARRQQGGAR